MEQSDLDLLHTIPAYHLQSLVKTRRLPVAMKGQGVSVPATPTTPTTPATHGNLSAASLLDVQEVAAFLFKPAAISEALRNLSPIERLLLCELVACGGRANSRDLALYMTSSGLLNTGKGPDILPTYGLGGSLYPTPHPHGTFEQALHRLLLLGLLFWGKQTNFAGRDYTNGVYDGVLVVPQAVKHVVNETFAHETIPLSNAAVVDLSADERTALDTVNISDTEDIGDGARSLQRMLYLYWSFIASLHDSNGQRGLPLVQSGLLSRSALRQIVDVLYPKIRMEQVRAETDVPYLLFIRLLLMALGLLREQGGTLFVLPARDYFMLPVVERARLCYRLWLEMPFWNELLYLPEVALRPVPAPLEPAQQEVMQGHASVVARVGQEHPGIWHDVATFIARTKLYAPNLLFPRQYGLRTERYSMGSNPYGWDFRLRHGWLTPREGWYQVEGGFIRSVVTGPLHWLGLVDTRTEEKRTLFRLSPGFPLITGDTTPQKSEQAPGRLIVQPNFELVALAPISEALLIRLDRFAERISLEHVAQYRLTKSSVTRAIQRGLYAPAIQHELEEASSSEIPQNVRYSLVEWERQARRVELWQGMSLLEVDDAHLLDDFFADETTRPLFGRRLAPTLAEVASHQLAAIQELLWQRDYLPAVSSAAQHDDLAENTHSLASTYEPQWRLHENGLLQPLYLVLDLYLVAEVERFTEVAPVNAIHTTNTVETESTTAQWRHITPTSMQCAVAAGLTLEAIIRFLQRYCVGGVPASFLIRLKLWSGGYSAQPVIQVEQSPMLYLSAQILQDLQSDEDLQDLLGPEIPRQGRLVHVSQENLERVVELLRERGFTVE
ncbi:MAG TPA: helicase-associated domain-containing protein [Ktedonobacteraceae bacterium]|nr:helicase-associated domain-containing protein [Ktedonobacteraceae bacterium]